LVKTYQSEPVAVARPDAVYTVDRMLQVVMDRGTGRAARAVLPAGLVVAGKSGTSSDLRDSWFAGFSGGHLIVAWVGYDDDRPTGLTGSTGALPIWADLMGELRTTSWHPAMPATLHDVSIDYSTGYAAIPGCTSDALDVPIPIGIDVPPKPGCVIAASPSPKAAPVAPDPPQESHLPPASPLPVQHAASGRVAQSALERIGHWLHVR